MRRLLRHFGGDDQGTTGASSEGAGHDLSHPEPVVNSGMGYALAGVIVGIVIAAVIGLDFWPSDPASVSPPKRALEIQRLKTTYTELEQELGEMEQKYDKAIAEIAHLRDSGVLLESPGLSSADALADADTVLEHLHRCEWRAFADRVERLLVAGDEGFPVLLEVATRALHDARLAQFHDGVQAALSRVAFRRARRTSDLIAYCLAAPAMDTDPVFAQMVLTRSAWYFAVIPETPGSDEQSRSMLVQSLQRRLLQGDSALSDVLANLEALGVSASTESLETLLEDDERSRDHATLLKYLGRRLDPEAVDVLARFIDSGDPGQWKTRIALRELAAKRDEAAEAAFKRLLESGDLAVRHEAHMAYFSVRSELSPGLSVLVEYLNSDVDAKRKTRLLAHVRSVNSMLFRALGREPGLLKDTGLQTELRDALATLPAGS